jgi:hypothetical protein
VGCNSLGKTQPDSTPQDQPKIDASLLVRCDDLPGTKQWESKIEKNGTMSLGNFNLLYGELQGLYTECAIRSDCLIEAVQGNKETSKVEKCVADLKKEKKK